MKTIQLLMVLLAGTFFTSHAQLMNPGFEDLNADGSIRYWGITHLFSAWIDSIGISHSDSIVIDQSFCQSSTDAHTGLRAVEMRNAYNYSTSTGIPGGAFLSADTMFSTYAGFVPVTTRPGAFGFYYKYFPVNQDTASAWIEVMNINGDIIGSAEIVLSSLVSAYMYTGLPITYTSNDSAAIMAIHFNASTRGADAQFGTRFLVDDISFANPNDVHDLTDKFSIGLYPNPAQTYFAIQSAEPVEAITIWNALGQEVFKQGSVLGSVSCGQLATGVYHVQVRTAKGMQTSKLTIQR